MDDDQEQKHSFRHFSTMPWWGKLGIIAAIIAVGVVTAMLA